MFVNNSWLVWKVKEDMWETKPANGGNYERSDYMPGREQQDEYGGQTIAVNTMFKINHGW